MVPTLRENISSSENLQRIVIANPTIWLATSLGNVSRLISPWLKRSLIRGPSWWFKKSQRKSCGIQNSSLCVFTENWIYSVYRISLKDKYMIMSIFQIFRRKNSANIYSILWQLNWFNSAFCLRTFTPPLPLATGQ